MHGKCNHSLPDQPAETDIPEKDLEQIKKAFAGITSQKHYFSYSLPVAEIDPLSLIEQRMDESYLYYWEQPDQKFALAAGGAAASLKSTGSDRFTNIGIQSRRLKSRIISVSSVNHSMSEPILVGGYSFANHNININWKNFGAAHFFLPKWVLLRSGKLSLLTLTVPIGNHDLAGIIQQLDQLLSEFYQTCSSIKSFTDTETDYQTNGQHVRIKDSSRNNWKNQVERSRSLIKKGVFEKVVIARQLELQSDQPIRVALAMYHLRKLYPECYNFIVRMDGGACFMGATPERLISLRKDLMQTDSLAGSISRGKSASEDVALGHTLMDSNKERSEHDFVVRDIRNNLEKHTSGVNHPSQPSLKKLSNVQHLYTPISARIYDSITIHELAGALHPTPAVGGFPKSDAVPFIHQIEEMDRGWYAGPTGWFNLNGFGELAVAIRSAWVDGNRARMFAGCGIVEDSDPETEWEETKIKFRPLLDALIKATTRQDGKPTD